MNDDSKVINFLNGSEPDSEGRYIMDVIKFDENEIEYYHDFIQWIFPTQEKSQYNYNAPVISDEFSDYFSKDINAQKNFCITCRKFLDFIGYSCQESNITILERPNSAMFYNRPSHNLLRITRVLKSLNQIGYKNCSQNLFKNLKANIILRKMEIPLNTIRYWESTQI